MRRILYIVIVCVLPLMLLQAQTVKELQKQQDKLKKEITETNKLLQQNTKSKTATITKLELLNKNINNQKRLIRNLNREINALDKEMLALGERRTTLKHEQERLKDDYARMCRESHFSRMQQSPLLFLLSSDSFRQLGRRVRYMQEMSAYRRDQVKRIEEVQEEIDTQNALLKENRKQKAGTMAAEQRERDNLARDERKQQQMLKQLKSKEKNLQADLKKKQKKVNDLNNKIEQMVRQQAAKQTKESLTKEQHLISTDFAKNEGRLPWPVEKGIISGYFGKHQHPVYEHVTIDNKGIYLQSPTGTKARSVFDGMVTGCFVMNNTYAVIVQHGEYRTVYAGLSQLNVKQGDKVKTKQTLGSIYTDKEQDNKTELYFQVWKGKEIQNPVLWLAK